MGHNEILLGSDFIVILLYVSESFAMTEQIKSSFKTWERIILRKIYGPIKDQNGGRI
jgi:hypothetical protein